MTQAIIEHVNLNVSDPARTAKLICDLLDWEIRWQGKAMDGHLTIHVGNKHVYFALHDNTSNKAPAPYAKGAPFNHVGLCVDDLDAIERRARTLGLAPFGHDDYEPGRRFYLLDADGIEYEFVSYIDTVEAVA